MKKLMLIAAAFATLVSCTKTQVIPTETAQQEISMKAYNQAAVKATGPITVVKLPIDELMKVWGYYANDESYSQVYLDGVTFADNGDQTNYSWWGGTLTEHIPYYWPTTGSMKILALYPDSNNISDTYNVNNHTPQLTINDIDLSNWEIEVSDDENKTNNITTTQKDLLYSNNKYAAPVACPAGTPVELVFNHLLARIYAINITADNSIVDLNEVKLIDINTKGSITIEENQSTVINYTITDQSNFTLYDDEQNIARTIDLQMLALPTVTGNNPKLSIKYTINGQQITHELALGQISAGNSYTYNITIAMNEILFKPSVETWTGQTIVPSEIN